MSALRPPTLEEAQAIASQSYYHPSSVLEGAAVGSTEKFMFWVAGEHVALIDYSDPEVIEHGAERALRGWIATMRGFERKP